MIDAIRARQIASDMVSAKAQIQLEEVEEKITREAENGCLYCQVEGYLLPQVTTYLIQLGYHVKQHSARNETWTNISWEAWKEL